VNLNERLVVFGYPLAGQGSVTLSNATCSGIVSEEDGEITAIKMHTQVDNGFSGGPVVQASTGLLVGIISHTLGQIDFAKPIHPLLRYLQLADSFIKSTHP